jgi:WXG100 family type VII secretion target
MANPDGVSVTHEAMQTQARRLAEAKNHLEEQLAQIKAQIEELVQTGFSTQKASESFREAQAQWNQAARTCVGELENMSQYLGKASEAFKSVDEQFTVKL